MATEQGLDLVQATGTIMLGWAQVQEGHGGNGAQQIRQGVEDYRATGASLQMPQFLAALSEAERAHGRSAEGLDVVADALTIVARTGERFFEADLHRLQGELLLDRSPDDHGPAECAFQQALSVARGQQARSLELRAAVSLSRLWQAQGKTKAARELLTGVYGRFTEGFDSKDLKEAKSLLDDLS
jgi:predicted ATPase